LRETLAANFYAFQRQILPILEKQNFCLKSLKPAKLTAAMQIGWFVVIERLFLLNSFAVAEKTLLLFRRIRLAA